MLDASEIRDVNGQLVHAVTITPIPLDRPPFPLPSGVVVPIYFTIQPGLAKIQNSRWRTSRSFGWFIPMPVSFRSARLSILGLRPSWGGWWVYGHQVSRGGRYGDFAEPRCQLLDPYG